MVRAELEYNPYLLETIVRFNGNPPRINSLIERYQEDKLQTWIGKVPDFFYDEMNGYYFELDFSGTKLDFEELQKSFKQAGVGKNLVQLFHKGELGSRHEKTIAISSFMKWLEENPNRKFDYSDFLEKNRNIFDNSYPFVVIGGTVAAGDLFADIEVSIDNVETVDELQKTDLHSTPILFYLDRKSARLLQHNLLGLLKRTDVVQEQLFFLIEPALLEKLRRVVQDLGVKTPKIVSAVNDNDISRYIELFPISEYIYEAIKAFEIEAENLGKILKEENLQSEITNKDIYEQIQTLDDILTRLKTSKDMFAGRGKLDFPTEFISAKQSLIEGIDQWKKKKTKITRSEEASTLSSELQEEVNRLFESFQKEVKQTYALESASILGTCDECFRNAKYQEDSIQIEDDILPLSEYSVPEMVSELMSIKDEEYVMPKEDFFGKLFKTSSIEPEQQPVLETTFYCEKWRAHAVSIVEPIAEKMIQEAYSSLSQYSAKISAIYMTRVDVLIQEVTSKRELTAAQLSKDEQLLQADNNWHTAFCDKLHEIERS